MTPRDRRACTHLARATEWVGVAYGDLADRSDASAARKHIDAAIAALMAASEAIEGQVLHLQPRETP